MSGTCLVKLPHKTDRCNSSDGLQVFENEDGSLTGFCFVCHTYVPDPMGEGKTIKDIDVQKQNKKTDEQILNEINFIHDNLRTISLKNERQLSEEGLAYYDIRVGLSEEDGQTPTFVYFPYHKGEELVGYKCKHLPTGRVWWISRSRDIDLFGWRQAVASGVRDLVIVEGEFDAPALHRILKLNTKAEYRDRTPAVVSIPNGAASAARDIRKALPEIKRHFNGRILICFDNDEAGRKATEEVCKLIPEAEVIVLPAKDANECIIKGLGKAAYKAVTFNSGKAKNSKLVWGRDIHEAAKQKAEWGMSWPWDKMTQLTRGIRRGETIYLGAGEKMGKSEVVNALARHLITEHNLKVLLAKPEESNVKTYKLLVGKVTGRIYHDPKVEFDEESFDEGGKSVMDKVCMLNLYQNITWDVLKQDIYAAASEGVGAVFIDPITNLTNGMTATQTNEHLQGVAQELAVLAKDLNIVIFIFCHLNKPPKGSTPWDRGGKITTDYFAGSSAMARSCNYAIGIEGNKDEELPEEQRNMRDIVLLADREFGEVGRCRLYWNKNNGLFTEIKE